MGASLSGVVSVKAARPVDFETPPPNALPKRATAFLALLPLSACAIAYPLPAGTAPFDPVDFFTGTSTGAGTLKPLVGKSVPITVTSNGTAKDGVLTLVQEISEGSKPKRTRSWTMRMVAPGRFTGTLTDARGPVEVTITGPRATVRYRSLDGLTIRQQLALQADGRTLLNRLEAFKFGVRLATLDETISRPLAK